MHLLALTKRSAFYFEEKRRIEERHISPVCGIVLRLPTKEVTGQIQCRGLTHTTVKCTDPQAIHWLTPQPISDEDNDASEIDGLVGKGVR